MTIDLLIAIGTTAAAAVVIWGLATSVPVSTRGRTIFVAVLAAWLCVAIGLAATRVLAPDGLGTPGVGLAVVLPVLAVAYLASRWPALGNALVGIPVPVLIAVNAVRVLGVFFLILFAQGRLPQPFAPSAGWGDIAVGITALPVAWMVAREVGGWRPVALIWNFVGFADLILAVALGVMSAPDSPVRIFRDGPDTSVMSVLPMFIIPGFLVPLLLLAHLAIFYRLRAPSQETVQSAAKLKRLL
jgi:hypothetical protein